MFVNRFWNENAAPAYHQETFQKAFRYISASQMFRSISRCVRSLQNTDYQSGLAKAIKVPEVMIRFSMSSDEYALPIEDIMQLSKLIAVPDPIKAAASRTIISSPWIRKFSLKGGYVASMTVASEFVSPVIDENVKQLEDLVKALPGYHFKIWRQSNCHSFVVCCP
jgi:hypothetical protein